MLRRSLMVAALMTVLAGCRDHLHTITAPDEPDVVQEAEAAVSTAALFAVWGILDDPFVFEVVEESGLDERKFYRTTADMTAVQVREGLGQLSESVHLRDTGTPEGDAEDEILRAVLGLILDDAESVATSHLEDESSPAVHAGRR